MQRLFRTTKSDVSIPQLSSTCHRFTNVMSASSKIIQFAEPFTDNTFPIVRPWVCLLSFTWTSWYGIFAQIYSNCHTFTVFSVVHGVWVFLPINRMLNLDWKVTHQLAGNIFTSVCWDNECCIPWCVWVAFWEGEVENYGQGHSDVV